MNVSAILERIRSLPTYRNQIVYEHHVEEREPVYSEPHQPLSPACMEYLRAEGIEHLYVHQADALDAIREGKDVLLVTGTASGKSLCYQLPLLEMIESDSSGRALLLYPTKALAQDQHKAFTRALSAAGMPESCSAIYDGDTPPNVRRSIRDDARLVLSNPDMLHAAILPQHTRWAEFFSRLRFVVVDEMHVYAGLFGSNAANLFRRLNRVCAHYGSYPQYVFCSATIANPREVARKLTGRDAELVDRDGSPRGKRTYIFWNPPRVRARPYRSRRSANVEAHELMCELVKAGIPTITFSKAKVTAELIHRYVVESLRHSAPHLAQKVTPYRGGYLAEERREIERKLFSGELLGVSTTRALELGIDVGGLDACIVVGYPGTLASFFQQSGRAGRRDKESFVVLVGVDTAVNQYVMNHPEYIFGRPIERLVIDADNPYVLAGHLRCAAYELPISEDELADFGIYADLAIDVLTEQHKLNKVRGKWYHAAEEVPQHEVSLRDYCDKNVTITDADTGRIIGEMSKFDAQPILHPEAIYLHQGETYIVLELDLDRYHCLVKKIETDYYTQPQGGTDVHHIDQPLRQKTFGRAQAYFGEVTAYFRTHAYEKIHFYSLDAISVHPLNMPTWQLETMAFWITPDEALVRELIAEGIDIHRGLMGIGYATRMILPLFIKCETLDFSHSSCTAINAPWHTVFVYERYPHGLGFTEQAFDILGDIMPAVYDRIRMCDCRDGCPCCVGKPLRGYTTWNIERGEATIPSKKAALRILAAVIGDRNGLHNPDHDSIGATEQDRLLLLERGIRRRLERMGDPQLFHPIDPNPEVGFPEVEQSSQTTDSDAGRRFFKRTLAERLAEAGEMTAHDAMDPLERARPRTHRADSDEDACAEKDVGPVSPSSSGLPSDKSRTTKDGDSTHHPDIAHERLRRHRRSQSKAVRRIIRGAAGRSGARPPQDQPQNTDQPPSVRDSKENQSGKTNEVRLGDSIASRARKLKRRRQ